MTKVAFGIRRLTGAIGAEVSFASLTGRQPTRIITAASRRAKARQPAAPATVVQNDAAPRGAAIGAIDLSVSRRFFLYGAGAYVTSAFARRAAAYSARTGRPLLITPDTIEGELHVYPDQGLITLGPLASQPESLTWLEYLVRYQGEVIESAADVERVLEAHEFESEEELYREMDLSWPGPWDSAANAYRLLHGLGLGPSRRPSSRLGWLEGLEFVDGPCPGNISMFVNAEDPVTQALLQARLLELGSGLKLVEARWP